MPSRSRLLLCAIRLACLPSGCGTVVNLNAPPPPGLPSMGPNTCFPFGGVTRSALLGTCAIPMGLCGAVHMDGGIEEMGVGLLWVGTGAVALVDAPLSLVGDLVTLPIAYARREGAPWATSWGDQGRKSAPLQEPPPSSNADPPLEPVPVPPQNGPAAGSPVPTDPQAPGFTPEMSATPRPRESPGR